MNAEKNRIKQRLLSNEIITMAVESSNISTWAYNPNNKVLTILFKKGTTYRYENVDKKTVLNFLLSESFGKAFHKYINGKFDYTKEVRNMVLA